MRIIGKRSVSSFLTVLLNVCWYVVALALALTVCLTAFSPFMKMPHSDVETSHSAIEIPTSFTVDAQIIPISATPLGIRQAHIRQARGSLIFPPPTTLAVVVPLTFLVFMLSFALWVLGELRALFRTLRDGQPFVPVNATRIRRIAYAVILAELVRYAVVFYSNYYVMTHFSAQGLQFDVRPGFNGFAIVCGLIILVIGEVFRAGTTLNEEQSLTI
jgi:DUF2975 family protein